MGIELLCEAARLPFPERAVIGIADVAFAAPFKFYRGEARTVRIEVRYRAEGEDLVAECALIGVRALHGRNEPERTRHFNAEVRLAAAPSAAVAIDAELPQPQGEIVPAETIYATYFHGPAYQVLTRAWRAAELVAGELSATLPANHSPGDAELVAAPRLIELAFQTAGLAEIADHARMGLPQGIERVTFHQNAPAEVGGSRAFARPRLDAYDVIVVDALGAPLLTVQGYRTSALEGALDNSAFAALRGGAIAR